MLNFKKIFIATTVTLAVLIVLSSSAIFVLAQNQGAPENSQYVPLSALPNTTDPYGGTDLTTYVKGMFGLLIGGAAVLAVIMIVIGGVQYMSTDAISGKSEGKEKITDALYGLMLAIACWLILYTINPDILKFDVLSGVDPTPEIIGGSAGPNAPHPEDPPGPYDKIIDCVRSSGPLAGQHTYVNNGHFEWYRGCINSFPAEREMAPPQVNGYLAGVCTTYAVSCDPTPPSPQP